MYEGFQTELRDIYERRVPEGQILEGEEEYINEIMQKRQSGTSVQTRPILEDRKLKVLIVGGSGYVGQYICRDLPVILGDKYDIYATFTKSNVFETHRHIFPGLKEAFHIDLSGDHQPMIELVTKLEPDFIINTSAMSAVPDCQANPDAAFSINNPSDWARAATKCIRFIHFSTDMVYHGDSGPYSETDDAIPIETMTYGVSKRNGEVELLKEVEATIVRSALVIGPPPVSGTGRGSTLEWMRKAIAGATKEKPARFFSNEMRSPVLVNDIVVLMALFIAQDTHGTDIPKRVIVNMGGASHCSRYEIGIGLAKRMNCSLDAVEPSLQEPIMGGIERPRDIRMTIDRLTNLVRAKMSTIDESLDYIFGIGPSVHKWYNPVDIVKK